MQRSMRSNHHGTEPMATTLTREPQANGRVTMPTHNGLGHAPRFHRPAGSRRILIIEDNTDGRETLRTLLELLGHRVETAEDGVKGLDKALSWRPEIALIDIGLPVLDGYEVARQLRRALGHSITLIAHTGYGQPEDRRRAFEAGFEAHLVKPVDLHELFHLLERGPRAAAST